MRHVPGTIAVVRWFHCVGTTVPLRWYGCTTAVEWFWYWSGLVVLLLPATQLGEVAVAAGLEGGVLGEGTGGVVNLVDDLLQTLVKLVLALLGKIGTVSFPLLMAMRGSDWRLGSVPRASLTYMSEGATGRWGWRVV